MTVMKRMPMLLTSPLVRRLLLVGVSVLLYAALAISYSLGIFSWGLPGLVLWSAFLFVLALISPLAVTFLLVVFTPVDIMYLSPNDWVLNIRPYQLIMLFAMFGWILWWWRMRSIVSFSQISVVDIGVSLFVLGSIIGAVFSESMVLSMYVTTILVSFACVYGILRVAVSGRPVVQEMLLAFFLSFIIVSLFAIWQNFAYLSGWAHNEVMPGRPNAFFSEPDWLGFFLALGVVIGWGIFLFAQSLRILHVFGRVRFPLVRTVMWMSVLFGTIALILTVSRSAWLATMAGIITLSLWGMWHLRRRGVWRILAISGTIPVAFLYVVVIPLSNFELFNRAQSSVSALQEITISCENEIVVPDVVNSDYLRNVGCRHINLEEIDREREAGNFVTRVKRNDPNAGIRQGVWGVSIATIFEQPLTGIGWGTIPDLLGKDPRGEDLNPSNIFLAVWLGSGILGVAGLVLIIGWIAARSWALAVRRYVPGVDTGVIVFSTLVVIGVFNFFNSGELLALTWAWLGIASSALMIATERRQRGWREVVIVVYRRATQKILRTNVSEAGKSDR